MGWQYWFELGVTGIILVLVLLRICFDFLVEGAFFCVERVLSVGVIVWLNL